MKTFVYRIETVSTRNGYTIKRCTLWRVLRNDIVQVAQMEYSFMSDNQAAIHLAENNGLIKNQPRTQSASVCMQYDKGWTVVAGARFKAI